ncbi:cryptochrome DASH [Apiospora aurea]|uniref:Cryptochrome DASH n=1 Tax=Apiospora aurea TaxID=335848 RepID=A0ABR1QQL1_9PEZI
MEPLRERPRQAVPKPPQSSLPDFPPASSIAPQAAPFEIPTDLDGFREAMLKKVRDFIHVLPPFPEDAESAHPFSGGETNALVRIDDIIKHGVVHRYKTSRNGLVGTEFSTKLSAWLALGCITGRQVHWRMVDYEDGKDETFAEAEGYGKGENEGSKGVRFELLWRDYMCLCHKKFGKKLFYRSGFREDHSHKWKAPVKKEGTQEPSESDAAEDVDRILQRIFDGTTGMGLIDATQRELLHTGYTSNRARQNLASFIAKHLNIDWRYGAEWYEMLLVDYDVSSNWANWQYVAGVGNDPRGEARIFNPVKQAFDYDKEGTYVRRWVPEVRALERLEHVFQCCMTPKEDWDRFNLTGLIMAEYPVKRIDFTVDGKPNKHVKRPFDRRRKDGRIRSATNTQVVTDRQPVADPSENAANAPNAQEVEGFGEVEEEVLVELAVGEEVAMAVLQTEGSRGVVEDIEAMAVGNHSSTQMHTPNTGRLPGPEGRCHGVPRKVRYRVPQALLFTPCHRHHHHSSIIRSHLRRSHLFSTILMRWQYTFRIRFTPMR